MGIKRILLGAATAAALSGTALAPAAAGNSGDYLAARQASLMSDYEAAAQYYTRAMIQDPGNQFLMENAVMAFVGLGEPQRAVPVARRLLQTGADSQIANMVLHADAVASGDFDRVLADLEAGQKVSPLFDVLLAAWSHIGAGSVADAIAAFDKAIEQPGFRAFALYHKGLALASVGDFEGAAAALETEGSLPLNRRGMLGRIQILSQLERTDEALDLLNRAFGDTHDPGISAVREALEAGQTLPYTTVTSPLEGVAEAFYTIATALNGETSDGFTLLYARMAHFLRPDHSDAAILAANLLEQLERYELAVETYRSIAREDPLYHVAEMGRAEALRLSGKPDAAIEVLTQLARTLPDMEAVHIALGDTLRRLERFDEAAKAYDTAIDLMGAPEPADWLVYFSRAISNEREGRWEQAEADFRTALELNPEQPQVMNYLGYSYVEMDHNLDEALDLIERAVAQRPDSGYITDSLGWVFYKLGRYEEAVTPMERAAELLPMDPIVNDHLGDVYWAVGRKTEARFQWRRALSFEPEEKDAERIRRKLEIGLDQVLIEEGADPITVANDDG